MKNGKEITLDNGIKKKKTTLGHVVGGGRKNKGSQFKVHNEL